jgi:hypothetical protein
MVWSKTGKQPTIFDHTRSQLATYGALLPPGFLMWASMYTAVFYVCGGMIAAMYSVDQD